MTADDRIHLIVLYGGQSAEHDVSCTTAAHVLRAADPARYRITPVGISRDGLWAIDTAAQAMLASAPDSLPGKLLPVGMEVDATPFISAAVAEGGPTVVMPMDFLRLPLSALLGYWLYNEGLDAWSLAGGALILAANTINIVKASRA